MRVALLSPHAVEVGDSGDRRRTLDLADALAEEGIEPEIVSGSWRSSTSRHADSPREVELTLARSRPVYLPWRLGLAARRIGNPYALHRDHRLRAAIIGAIQEREYDVVDVQHSYMDCRWPIPTVLTVHNVLANPDFLAGTRYQRRTVKKLESASLADCDRAIVFSESERRRVTAILRGDGGSKGSRGSDSPPAPCARDGRSTSTGHTGYVTGLHGLRAQRRRSTAAPRLVAADHQHHIPSRVGHCWS